MRQTRKAEAMDNIVDRSTTYSIFTSIVPGVMYCFFSEMFYGIVLVRDNILVALVFY